MMVFCAFFFFSSRRRHTRCSRDWSSDVCSSDLDLRIDNPRNLDVRGITRREIAALFPSCRIELRRVTLAPPVARWVAARSRTAAFLLAGIPLLRTHYLGALQPGAPA